MTTVYIVEDSRAAARKAAELGYPVIARLAGNLLRVDADGAARALDPQQRAEIESGIALGDVELVKL